MMRAGIALLLLLYLAGIVLGNEKDAGVKSNTTKISRADRFMRLAARAAKGKLTGQKCNPKSTRPCRFPDEMCTGTPPVCVAIHPDKQVLDANGMHLERYSDDEHIRKVRRGEETLTNADAPVQETDPDSGPMPENTDSEEKGPGDNSGAKVPTDSKKDGDSSMTKPKIPDGTKPVISDDKKNAADDGHNLDTSSKPPNNHEFMEHDDPAPTEDTDQNIRYAKTPSVEVEGTVFYTGDTSNDPPCLLPTAIDKVINGNKTVEDKKAWVSEHAKEICDQNKFQFCTETFHEEVTTPANQEDSGKEAETDKGSCRCGVSSMVIQDDGVCGIAVGLTNIGSICGKEAVNYKPVPGHEGGMPTLRPKCVKNAECISSRLYFGLRCRCKAGHIHVQETHTCSTGNRLFGLALSLLHLPVMISLLPLFSFLELSF